MRLNDLFEFGGEPQKVSKVAGNKVTLTDPKKPGIETTIDTDQVDIDNKDPNNPVIKAKKPGQKKIAGGLRPGQTVSFGEGTIEEGVNDPHIFKALFMAGGPGSGKSFVAKNILGGTGLRPLNSDEVYELLMKKQDLDLDPDSIASPQGQEIRGQAKNLTKKRSIQYISGRLGLLVDGTGKEVDVYKNQVKFFKQLGYDCAMIFVNTSLDVAQQRNKERDRILPPKMVKQIWDDTQQNVGKYQQIFGANKFFIVDNSGGLEDPTRSKNFDKVYNNTQKFLNSPVSSKAQQWIDKAKEKTKTR